MLYITTHEGFERREILVDFASDISALATTIRDSQPALDRDQRAALDALIQASRKVREHFVPIAEAAR